MKPVYKRAEISTLIIDPQNARLHDEKNIGAIKGSIQEFGQVEPIVVQKSTKIVIGGNARLGVLKGLGYTEVDIVELDINDKDARALALALNRTSELAAWDMDVLGTQLQGLFEEGFDIGALGFNLDDYLRNFEPGDESDQGKLDEKKKVICPDCGHEF